MKRVLVVLVAFLIGCGPLPPINPPKPPAEACPATCPLGTECKDPERGCQPIPAPGPVCADGQTYGCWHWPPDSSTWLYACPVYRVDGQVVGVINVVGGPAQCPAKPVTPPVEPPPTKQCENIEARLSNGPDTCSAIYTDTVQAITTKLGPMTGQSCDVKLAALASEFYSSTGKCAFAGQEAAFMLRGDGTWEENHACSYADGGWTNTGRGVFKGCHVDSATPPPATGGCTSPVPPKVHHWWGPKQHNRINDSTPLFYGGDEAVRWDGSTVSGYCKMLGMGDKLFCPARNECPATGENVDKCKERPACEAIGVSGSEDGKPLWRSDGAVVLTDNPFQASCSGCTWLEVCAADGTACARCNVDQSTGLCAVQ